MEKFTAIYEEVVESGSWSGGCTYILKMKRIDQFEGETVEDMLKRESIHQCARFLFKGHPPLQGEAE